MAKINNKKVLAEVNNSEFVAICCGCDRLYSVKVWLITYLMKNNYI